MDNQKKAYGYALATVLLWSTVASAFKITLRYLTFLEMLFLASLTSAVAIFGILCIQGKLGLLGGMTRREWLHSAFLGLLNPFAYYLILFKHTTSSPPRRPSP